MKANLHGITSIFNYPSFAKPFVAHYLLDCDRFVTVYYLDRDPFVAAHYLVARDATSPRLHYLVGDRHP